MKEGGDPESDITRRRVFRFDAEMLVTPHLAELVGHDSPRPHLRRYQDDGLFDRFACHASELWSNGRDV